MIPKQIQKMLERDKIAYQSSNQKLASLDSKIQNVKLLLSSKRESIDLFKLQSLRMELRDLKHDRAQCLKENTILKKQFRQTIKYCESHVVKKVLPSFSDRGMSRYDFLPRMRSKVTGRIAEYSLVCPEAE